MKKHIQFLCISALYSATAFAQTDKGTILLGANLGIGSVNNAQSFINQGVPASNNYGNINSSTYSSLVITPSVGYFIFDKFAVGLSAGYSQNKTESSTSNTQGISQGPQYTDNYSTVNYSISPYARYYFPLGEKAAIFTQLSVGYAYTLGKTESTTNDFVNPLSVTKFKSDGQTFFVSFFPGFSYSVTHHFSLELSIGSLAYTSTKTNSTPDATNNTGGTVQTSSSSGLALNLTTSSVLFGFKYSLRK
jgi:hypothetical protein